MEESSSSGKTFDSYIDYYIAAKQIRPVHLFADYDSYMAAVEQVRGDVVPLPFAWQFVAHALPTWDTFCEFVNTHNIENWVFDNGSRHSIRFRLSDFKQATLDAGLARDESFRLR